MNSEECNIIATFSHNPTNLVITPASSFTVEECKIKSRSQNSSVDVGKRHRRREAGYKLTVDGHKISYVGQTELSASEWLVAVRNKRTGELAIKPAHFVNFRPVVKEDNADQHDDSMVLDKEVANKLRDKLTVQYGSKKRKRALEAKLANSVSDASLRDTVNVAVTRVKDETVNEGDTSASLTSTPTVASNPYSSVLPAFNHNATSPAEIFDINDIVSSDDCQLLKSEAEQFETMSQSQRMEAKFNYYTCELATKLPSHAEARRMRCTYLVYFDHLIKLCQMSASQRPFCVNDCVGASNAKLMSRLMIKFAEKQSGSKQKSLHRILPTGKDKLLSHLIILTLHLNNFSFALSNLGALVPNTNAAKLVAVCKVLGCNIKTLRPGNERFITLTKPPSAVPRLEAKKTKYF